MGPQLRQRLLLRFPEWHAQPLRLTMDEMNDPGAVLDEFFELYSLPDLRACLEQWLEDALDAGTAEAAAHYQTCRHIEKLAEAAWMLRAAK